MLDDKDSVFPINRYLGPDFFCNREGESNKLDSKGVKKIERQHVIDVMTGTVKEQDALMSSIKAMLPVNQYDLFRAICMEDEIRSYTSRDFIQKHKLPSSAAVVQSIKALEEKEMIYMSGIDPKTGRAIYEAYNVFFAKWVKHRKAVSGRLQLNQPSPKSLFSSQFE